MRGGDDADVHGQGLGAAYPFELFLLEHTQELHLRVGGQFSDFVEKNRAAVGAFEARFDGAPRRRHFATRDGQPVYLRDVASVTRGYKDREAITRVDGREAVELAVYKEGDANTVQLAEGVRKRIEELGKALPEGTEIRVVYDQSKFIAEAIGDFAGIDA